MLLSREFRLEKTVFSRQPKNFPRNFLAIGPLPTIALVIGLGLAYFYPITREAHSEILMRLAERRRQQSE